MLHDCRYLVEADSVVEIGGDRGLVGRVHGARNVASPFRGFEGEAQSRELFVVGLLEGKASELGEVEPLALQRQPLRVGEGVLYRLPHVRAGQLGDHRTVLELYHRMDDALWLDYDVDFLRRHVEEPFGLDHLETLVHHSGRIYGDLRTHRPVRMAQGLILGGLGYQDVTIDMVAVAMRKHLDDGQHWLLMAELEPKTTFVDIDQQIESTVREYPEEKPEQILHYYDLIKAGMGEPANSEVFVRWMRNAEFIHNFIEKESQKHDWLDRDQTVAETKVYVKRQLAVIGYPQDRRDEFADAIITYNRLRAAGEGAEVDIKHPKDPEERGQLLSTEVAKNGDNPHIGYSAVVDDGEDKGVEHLVKTVFYDGNIIGMAIAEIETGAGNPFRLLRDDAYRETWLLDVKVHTYDVKEAWEGVPDKDNPKLSHELDGFYDYGCIRFGDEKEIEEYRRIRESGERIQSITILSDEEMAAEAASHTADTAESTEPILETPPHDTGNVGYSIGSFFLPIIGLIGGGIFKRHRHIRNYKACKKGGIAGLIFRGAVLGLFLLALGISLL